jgi:hypothetical protein
MKKWINRIQDTYTPGGYLFYLRTNMTRWLINPTLMADPAAYERMANPETWRVEQPLGSTDVEVELAGYDALNQPDAILVYRAGGFTSGGYHARRHEFRLQGLEATPYVYTDAAPTPGLFYWYRAKWIYEEGVVGNEFEAQVEVV